ncbi:MAG: hypothetical protein M5U22_12090 [Thermoleophilia bacterium]|nr:hypothetical protein [Thermoleophilia bacterium]
MRSISCPRCAGPLLARDGDRLISCGHCGTPFLTSLEDGFSRRYFPAKVEKLQAVGGAARWLWKHSDTPDDIRESAFVEARLLYVPIWELRAYVVGWEFGKKLRSKAETVRMGDEEYVRVNLVEEGVEAGFLDERRFYQEAADLTSLGMGRPHVTGREFTLPYLPGELEKGAAVLGADRDLGAVRSRARESFVRPPTGTVTRNTRLFLMKEQAALIYYPLWALRYRYRGRLYEMTVDGRSGVIHAARAPADNSKRLGVLIGSYAALAVALALAVSAWEAWEGAREPAMYVAVLVAVLAFGVYWRFRLLREVEYHEPFSG